MTRGCFGATPTFGPAIWQIGYGDFALLDDLQMVVVIIYREERDSVKHPIAQIKEKPIMIIIDCFMEDIVADINHERNFVRIELE